MRAFFSLASAVTILMAVLAGTACAQSDPVYLVTYVELMPNAAASGTALLKQYRGETRRESGNLRLDVLVEIKRPNRFVIVEVWKSKAELDAHGRSAASAQFSEKLKALQDAPNDVRIDHALYLGRGKSDNRTGAIYVVTHIDVIPPGKDACMAALKTMSSDTANDFGQYRLRRAAAGRSLKPFHRGRGMDRRESRRLARHGSAHTCVSRKADPDQGRALRRALLHGAELKL